MISARTLRNGMAVLLLAAAVPAQALTAGSIPLSPDQARHIGALTGLALYHLARAQEALRGDATPRLADETLQLGTLLDLVQAAEPTGAFQTVLRYARADLQRKNNDQLINDLLPLYRVLDALGPGQAVAAARTGLDGVVQDLERDERGKVPERLDALAATLEIPAIDAPLKSAREGVATVLTSLRGGTKPKVAEMLAIEQNLQQLLTGAIPPQE